MLANVSRDLNRCYIVIEKILNDDILDNGP